MTRTVAVVLAAGGSSRLGRPKQLLDYRGEPLLRHAARVALGAGCEETLVVIQPGAGQVLSDLNVRIIENAEWPDGVSTSIRAAVNAAGKARILFTLCDQARVTSEHLRALLQLDAPIAATGYSGIAGVPAAFDWQFREELLALRGDRGARALIEAHRDAVVTIPFEDAAIDIDTDADYGRL